MYHLVLQSEPRCTKIEQNRTKYQALTHGTVIAFRTWVNQLSARVALILAIALPGGIHGAQDDSNRRTLTLDEALALAERYNPRLRAGTASVDEASAAIKTASAWANPSLNFGTFGRQQAIMDTSIPGMLNGFSFNQPVELPNLRRTRIRAAEIRRQSTEFTLREAKVEVLCCWAAYVDVLRRRAEQEAATENLALLEDLRRRIQAQVKAGEAARLELVRADAELASARLQVKSAELRRTIALSSLYGAIGTPLGNPQLVPLRDKAILLPPLEELRSEAVSSHPSVAFAASETRRSEAILDFEKAQRMPQPTVWVDVFQQPDAAQYRFGVSLSLPVWNQREGPIAEAQAAQRRSNAVAQQRRREVSAAVERAYNLYVVTNQQVEILEAGTMKSAESAVQAAEAAFRFGERGIVEVLDARRVLHAARVDYLNAVYDRQEALMQLEQLTGSKLNGDKP